MLPRGKGYYIWKAKNIAGGDPQAIAELAISAGLGHVLIKIADGTHNYNVSVDLPAIVAALKDAGLHVFGWHYLYGYAPAAEARKAIERVRYTGVDAYVMDVEGEFKEPGADVKARMFMSIFHDALPNMPVWLSTYRFPSYHPQVPYHEFIPFLAGVMPQMYWEGAHNPAEQLLRSYTEWKQLAPGLPYIPTGAAYQRGSWAATPKDVIAFLVKCRELALEGANFWEWVHARKNLPDVWRAIADFDWPVNVVLPPALPPDEIDLQPVLEAIISHDSQIMSRIGDLEALVIEVRDAVANLELSPPPPEPEPETQTVQVRVRDDKALAHFVRDVNSSGFPIMEIWPSETSPASQRVKFTPDDGPIDVLADGDKPNWIRADGVENYVQLAPWEYSVEADVDLYLAQAADIKRALDLVERHDLETANLLRNYIRGLEARLAAYELEFAGEGVVDDVSVETV